MDHEYVIAYADKSVLKISGVKVKGLNTRDLEEKLGEKLKTFVRVIGVTGDNIEMDVYDIDPSQVRKNEDGLIESLALVEGVTSTELTKLSCSDKIVAVDFDKVPDTPESDCMMERWMKWPRNHATEEELEEVEELEEEEAAAKKSEN